jgi:uncharacterized membrane protein
MMEFGDMGSFGWAWMAFGLVFWVTVVAFIAWAVGQLDRGRPTSENAEDILRRRYAGGEIDDKEFESARRTLRRG